MVMDEQKKGKRKGGRLFFIIFLRVIPALIVIGAITYTVVYTLSVRNKVHDYQSITKLLQDNSGLSAEEWQLVRDKAFVTARLSMAANDSIGVTLNLQDSLVQLEVKGVVLRQIHFREAEISRFFRSFNPDVYTKTFSKPFKISEFGGTIVKDPITVKKAPKDSIEAAKNITAVDTTKIEFVEWYMLLNHALIVSFIQSDHKLVKMDKTALQYRYDRYFNNLTGNIRDMLHLKKPVFYPQITIFITKNEAKSFYRALSRKGEVVIRL
jgi:hypothetical protein